MFMLWMAVLISSNFLCSADSPSPSIHYRNRYCMNIVSVIDINSATLSLIKTHSLIENTNRKDELCFKFLVINQYVLELHKTYFTKLFPNTSVEYRLLALPSVFSKFSNRSYEKPSVFARLLIPTEFPNLSFFLYLDNDIVVNVDIAEVYHIPLYNRRTRQYQSSGFTVEHSRHHAVWVKAHFNRTHPLYQHALSSYRNPMLYLNSGVWLCNATLWRSLHLTEKVMTIIERSFEEYIYNRNVTSDQEIFYLLLQRDEITELPTIYNMGLHSFNKFVNLQHMKRGVIHFAAYEKHSICTKSVKRQPRLGIGAHAYFLSVSNSLRTRFENTVNSSTVPYLLKNCDKALKEMIGVFNEATKEEALAFSYDPGLGNFSFPPME